MLNTAKKYVPLIIIIVLTTIGIIGYTSDKKSKPVRVFFKTRGGPVVFTHKKHIQEYGNKCLDCHHLIEPEKTVTVWKCRDCHRAGTDYESICDTAPHVQCIGWRCTQCHSDLGLDSGECTSCHRL